MDVGSIFLFLGLLLLVGLFISRPLFERSPAAVNQDEHELSALLAERERLLDALQELDFDHSLGKIPETEYPAQRTALLQSGAEVLRQLDALQTETYDDSVDTRIEAAIAARREEMIRAQAVPNGQRMRPVRVIDAPDDELETMLAARRRERSEKSIGFCPQCGGPVRQSDHFCPKCGTSVK